MNKVGAQRGKPRGFLERLPLAEDRPLVGYAAALLAAAAAFALRLALVLPGGFPFATFFPAVTVVAFLFGARAGVLTAVISGLLGVYFFLEPVHSFELDAASAVAVATYLFTAELIIILIHWMQAAQRRLEGERQRSRALADNREMLFRELQHRVSNNLQVVAALLALQKRDLGDPAARAALDEASRRLGLIGRIHRQLYDFSGERIGMARFLSQLCSDVIDSSGKTDVTLKVEVEDTLNLHSDAAIPVALIVAEAIANAMEHGFGARSGGTIRVALAKGADGTATLEVEDDGAGLPDGFSMEKSTSLGLRIASTLSRQLGGRFELLPAGGACARLTLPASATA